MCTAFKRHYNTIFDKHCTKMSGIFLYFSNNMDKKESINDVNVNDGRRKVADEILYNVFNNLVKMLNSNLIRNDDHLLAMLLRENHDVFWVGKSKKRDNSAKFKLSYYNFL